MKKYQLSITILSIFILPFALCISPILAKTTSVKEIINTPFIPFNFKTLDGKEHVFPKDFENKMTLFLFGFDRKTEKQMTSWQSPLKKKYTNRSHIKIYQIPMIGKNLFSLFIEKGMKSGIPKHLHTSIGCYFGDLKPFKEKFSFKKKTDVYAILVDQSGQIIFMEQGFASEEKIKQLNTFLTAFKK